jgi:hypothetical protein
MAFWARHLLTSGGDGHDRALCFERDRGTLRGYKHACSKIHVQVGYVKLQEKNQVDMPIKLA